jgi:uncharacterized membrane protein YkoI
MASRLKLWTGLTSLAVIPLLASAPAQLWAKDRGPGYTSSVQVTGKHRENEMKEAARYADQAKIDIGQAIQAAQTRVPGKVLSALLDNEDGNLVYSVVVQSAQAGGPLQDVKVDSGNGSVLKVAATDGRKEEDDDD